MRFFDSTISDVRYALRMMKSSSRLSAVAIVSLALGIGATIAIFSVIYALALRPLPVQRPEQLVVVLGVLNADLHTYAEWKIFREQQGIFSGVLAYNHSHVYFQIVSPTGKQEIEGAYVSGDYFSTLGVSTVLGRPLQVSDDQPGTRPVCVLGYGLWRRLFNQSRDVLGRTIRVNGNEFVIVGVAPKPFLGVEVGNIVEIFMPLETQRTYKDYPLRYGHRSPSLDDPATIMSIAGRLKPGMSVNQANAGLQVLGAAIHEALLSRPDGSRWQRAAPRTLSAQSMQYGTSDSWLQSMDVVLLLMAMAAVALVIACSNLGNLLLARAAKRRSEIATRLAVGASRWRLVRQLLTESAALSLAGGVAGVLLARWGSQALIWALSYPPDDLLLLDLSWDAKLAAFAVGLTFACALLFGMAPALGATQISLSSAMNNGMATGKPRSKFMNSALVVVQVALSVAVLVSAGLLGRTLQAFSQQDLGYDPNGVVTVQAAWQGGDENPQRDGLVGEEILKTFRSLPGVTSAFWWRTSSSYRLSQLTVPGPGGAARRLGCYLSLISADSFKTRRAPILAGRDFNDGDSEASPAVAILSETLARALFGAVNPVGLKFREEDGDSNGQSYYVEVVGVARDMQTRRPDYGPLLILHRPVSQCGSACLGIGGYEIRVAGGFAENTKRLESAAAAVDSHVSLKFGLLSHAMDTVLHRNRAMALTASAFGMFVGLLAMIGVYGVTSHATAARTREIGVRMALGAEQRDMIRMLLGEMMRVVSIGVVFGLGAAFAAGATIREAIWGVPTTDPLSLGFASCLMLVIAGIAAFVPARRAMRVDPMVALRYE